MSGLTTDEKGGKPVNIIFNLSNYSRIHSCVFLIIFRLISRLFDFQEQIKGQKSTKLHQLILEGEVEEVEKLLAKGGGR